MRRNPRAGLFNGHWLTMDGQKIRKIRRDEYGSLYGLWRRHADVRLGVMQIGMKAPWTR